MNGYVLDYQDLLDLESMGKFTYPIPRLRIEVSIKQLLAGVDSTQMREEQQHRASDSKYDLRGATINNFAPEGEGNALLSGQTVQGNTVIGTQNNPAETTLNQEQVLALLAQIKALIAATELPAEVKIEANAHLKTAQQATAQEKPKKEIALATLENMAKTLETASQTVEAGKTLWEQVRPIVVQAAGWLGAAAGSVLMGL